MGPPTCMQTCPPSEEVFIVRHFNVGERICLLGPPPAPAPGSRLHQHLLEWHGRVLQFLQQRRHGVLLWLASQLGPCRIQHGAAVHLGLIFEGPLGASLPHGIWATLNVLQQLSALLGAVPAPLGAAKARIQVGQGNCAAALGRQRGGWVVHCLFEPAVELAPAVQGAVQLPQRGVFCTERYRGRHNQRRIILTSS